MRWARAAALVTLGVLALAAPAAAQTSTGADARDHVVVAGGFMLQSGAVANDVVVVDGDVFIGGRVTGDLVAVAGDVELAPGARVEGDLTTVAGTARLRPGAEVIGDLVHLSERPDVSTGATVRGEVRDEDWGDLGEVPWAVIGAAALWLAVSLSLLVAGVVLVALLPRVADAADRAARSQFALTLAMGLAWGIGLPLIAGLALVSLVGIPLGIVLILALVPMAFIGYIAACHVLGRLVVSAGTHPILAFLAGLAILRVLALIPVAGALVWVPAVVVGIGALIAAAMERGRGEPRIEPGQGVRPAGEQG